MGLFADTVPRDLYDALVARYDDLLNKYHALRPTHSPVSPMRVVSPTNTPENVLRAAEAAVADPTIAGAADKLMAANPKLDRNTALIEAKRLYDISRGRDLPTSPK